MQLAVHNGGSEVAWAALLAGLPALVFPLLGTQFTWTSMLVEAGTLLVSTRNVRDGLRVTFAC